MGHTSRSRSLILVLLLSLFTTTTSYYSSGPVYGPAVPPQAPISYNLQPQGYQQTFHPTGYGAQSQGFAQIVQPYGQGGALGQPALNGGANIVGAASAGVGGGVDSALAGGVPGGPGIRFRINKPGFRYAGEIVAPILSNQIRNARIPSIHQCLPQVDGCLRVDNIMISNYQCPERIQIRPSPPNQVVIVVKNANFQVTGNLAGKVTVLAPLALGGQFIASAQGISISVGLTVQRSPSGSLSIGIGSCHATVGYISLQIVNGGTLGALASSPTFSQKISRAMKKILPPRVCAQLPQILNEQVNGRLSAIPMNLPLTRIIDVAGGALKGLVGGGGDSAAPKAECPAECKEGADAGVDSGSQHGEVTNQLSVSDPPADPPQGRSYGIVRGAKTHKKKVGRNTGQNVMRKRTARATQAIRRPLRASPRSSTISRHVIQAVRTAKRQVDCTPCHADSGGDTASFLTTFTKSLDMSKLNDLQLSLALQNTYATTQDFTVDLAGEFSPNGAGGTPFSPFPLNFPQPQGAPRMAEGLISDYTINSLLYWLHQKGFINIKVGPDTPKIGDILKTTCSDDEEEGLEDHGVELDDGTGTSDIALRRRIRAKRQDDGGSLSDLGICIGDILPAIREKHPNQKLEILVKSSSAPSVVLSEGKAHVTLNIDAELYIQSSQEKVGTIAAQIEADIEASTSNNKLSGTATIGTLNLKDKDGTLGLPQDALDNLASLGKDFAEKAINDALSKGISLDMPSGVGGLPVSFSNPDFRIVDHALYVAADLSVDQNGLAPLLAQQGLSLTPDQCSTRGGK